MTHPDPATAAAREIQKLMHQCDPCDVPSESSVAAIIRKHFTAPAGEREWTPAMERLLVEIAKDVGFDHVAGPVTAPHYRELILAVAASPAPWPKWQPESAREDVIAERDRQWLRAIHPFGDPESMIERDYNTPEKYVQLERARLAMEQECVRFNGKVQDFVAALSMLLLGDESAWIDEDDNMQLDAMLEKVRKHFSAPGTLERVEGERADIAQLSERLQQIAKDAVNEYLARDFADHEDLEEMVLGALRVAAFPAPWPKVIESGDTVPAGHLVVRINKHGTVTIEKGPLHQISGIDYYDYGPLPPAPKE